MYRGVWSHPMESSHQALQEEVAVKTLEEKASEEDRIKFLQEAATMGQFDHPNIIRLIGITFNMEKVLYLLLILPLLFVCMQLMLVVDLMGGDLREYLLKLKSSWYVQVIRNMKQHTRGGREGMSFQVPSKAHSRYVASFQGLPPPSPIIKLKTRKKLRERKAWSNLKMATSREGGRSRKLHTQCLVNG